MDVLEKLITKRDTIRRLVIQKVNQIEREISKAETTGCADTLQGLSEILDDKRSTLSELNREIESHLKNGTELDENVRASEIWNETIIKCKARVKAAYKNAKRRNSRPVKQKCGMVQETKVKIEKLGLPRDDDENDGKVPIIEEYMPLARKKKYTETLYPGSCDGTVSQSSSNRSGVHKNRGEGSASSQLKPKSHVEEVLADLGKANQSQSLQSAAASTSTPEKAPEISSNHVSSPELPSGNITQGGQVESVCPEQGYKSNFRTGCRNEDFSTGTRNVARAPPDDACSNRSDLFQGKSFHPSKVTIEKRGVSVTAKTNNDTLVKSVHMQSKIIVHPTAQSLNDQTPPSSHSKLTAVTSLHEKVQPESESTPSKARIRTGSQLPEKRCRVGLVYLHPSVPINYARPLRHGWVRQIVYRTYGSSRKFEVYYISPKPKRVRFAFTRFVSIHLKKNQITNVRIKDFDFIHESISKSPWEIVQGDDRPHVVPSTLGTSQQPSSVQGPSTSTESRIENSRKKAETKTRCRKIRCRDRRSIKYV